MGLIWRRLGTTVICLSCIGNGLVLMLIVPGGLFIIRHAIMRIVLPGERERNDDYRHDWRYQEDFE
jgi:hypothetical protein